MMRTLARRRAWFGLLAPVLLFLLLLGPGRAQAQSTPAIAITATPDPVRPGELVQYVITTTNRSAAPRPMVVALSVPNRLTVASAAISRGGGCSGASTCVPGSGIGWNLGTVGAGQSATVQFSALVSTTDVPPDGTILTLGPAAGYTDIAGGANGSVDVRVSSARLSLGMVPASGPAVPGNALSHVVEFGNPGVVSSPALTLAVPVPAGTSFVSATGGGVLVGNTVQWRLGALPPGGAGQRGFVVQIDPTLASGSLVTASADLRNAATGASLARANAAAAVSSSPATALAITATPDPVRPGGAIQYTITATNRSAAAQGLSIAAQVPNYTTVAPSAISPGGTCASAPCTAGSTIAWSFPSVAAGQSVTAQFSAVVSTTDIPADGTVVRASAAVRSAAGDQAAGVDVAVSAAPLLLSAVNPRDFNGDGRNDLIWQNTRTGQRVIWYMNGTAFAGTGDFGTLDPAWRFAGTGDFNGDGKPDMVLQNIATGDRYVWFLDGIRIIGSAFIGRLPTSWQIAAIADLNADGKPDLVWQNTATGQRVVWFMDGSSFAGTADLGTLDTAWSIVGTGDFNGDGRPDIVLQNTVVGDRYVWFMNGTAIAGGQAIGNAPVSWSIVGTADFNGDGNPDIVLQNGSTGERVVWFMSGARYAGGASLGSIPPDWSLVP
jgi:hypothetical protein